MTDKTPGKIITFYSYKGGTGRTMALANVAWILACGGQKVLVIDWDLEAPGLHRYFYPFLIDKELTASDGLIDFVINFALEAVTPNKNGEAKPDWYVPYANILRYVVSLNYKFPRGGRLDFVPAGRQGLSYAPRVNSFDWQKFYERLGGALFFDEVKRQMRQEYDYILIDSRTGVSDTSGICTIQMPDILVSCFTLNNQGIDGALRVTKSVFEQRKNPLFKVFPVPMRLDIAENDKLTRRTTEARNKFFPFPNHLTGGDWEKYWADVQVFYIPYYSYEEVLAVFAQESISLSILSAAEKLTKYLTDNAVEGMSREELPTQEERAQVVVAYSGRLVEIDLQTELNQLAENAVSRLSVEDKASTRRIIERLIKIPRPEEDNGDIRQRVQLDNFPLSEQRIVQELRDSRLLLIETDSVTGKQTVQLARNEFLESWRQLQRWLQEDREFLQWLASLRAAEERWRRTKADGTSARSSAENPDDLLLQGDELTVAQTWLKERYADIYPAERAYIESSRRKNDAGSAPIPVKPKVYFTVPNRNSANLIQAQNILRGQQAEPREMLELAKRLKAETRFSYARRLLARAKNHPSVNNDKKLRHTIFQQLALCTYKDQDLPTDERLDRALEILKEIEDFATTVNQETLGLIGSIYKRKWEVDNQRQNLERSLHYYLRGYQQGPANDQGYTGINAAFILDQLASLEEDEAEKASRTSVAAEQRRAKAREIRQDIINQVGGLISDPNHQWVADKWWYYATLAEAHFGLQNYDEAVQWLSEGQEAAGEIYEWELETCARQLAALARLQDDENLKSEDFAYTPAWGALERAFGANAVPRTAFLGKIGLALSGGGFRASLYHLGVLARLAELDVLRQVEVLSCVSGGSIVGAYYYLMVRHLLQTKTEEEITREDYIRIVHEMIDKFVIGVQQNIRTRVALNPFKNLRMFWEKDYSRTARAGELYEECLYSRVEDGGQHEDRWLNGLTIAPLTKKPDGAVTNDYEFAPKYQNWRRDAKVPILVLNAATLNTGHTWQFTASWMGESPSGVDSEVNLNDRLRRMYYPDAPKEHKQIRLGYAVGASAAVPGIFEPLTLDYLYPDRIIRLVDGGVCDNQGVASLFEQDCKVMLVSDASGQVESQLTASRNIFGVLIRTNDIFQARIRDSQYHDLKGRHRSGLLRGLMFVHLKEDLEVDPIDWINCPDPYVASDDSRPPSSRGVLTRYGIAKDLQKLLSGIRTDLDSFSEVEAYALMTSGYRMTEYQFKYEKCIEGFSEPQQSEPWKFLQIEENMKGGGERYEYLKNLFAAGGSIAFKVWKVDPWLKYGLRIVLLLIAALLAALIYWQWDQPLPGHDWAAEKLKDIGRYILNLTPKRVALTLLTIFSGYILLRILTSLIGDYLARKVVRVVRWKDTLRRFAIAIFLSTIGFVLAVVHLLIFDKRFLSLGSMDNLKKRGST